MQEPYCGSVTLSRIIFLYCVSMHSTPLGQHLHLPQQFERQPGLLHQQYIVGNVLYTLPRCPDDIDTREALHGSGGKLPSRHIAIEIDVCEHQSQVGQRCR